MSQPQMNLNGEEIEVLYNQIKSVTGQSYTSTDDADTMSKLVNAINQILSELNVIDNQLALANNVNQENLIKRSQLLRMQNEELMNQLRELEAIQSNIANKSRMLDQMNTNMTNEQININTLIISIVLSILLLGIIIAYGYQRINKGLMILCVIVIVISYVILFFYNYNIFYINDAWNSLFNLNTEARLGYALQNWSANVKNNVDVALFGTEQNWINQNCNCPASSPSTSEEGTYNYPSGNNIAPQPGYFYYDGSAPPQLLVPSPQTLINAEDSINWVDYSQNGQASYNSSNNSTTYNDTNYYNYNTSDPVNQLKNALNNSNILTNNTTSTINM